MKQPVGLILAGGSGRRMGGADKAFLRLGPATLLGHVLARIEPRVSCVALSANGDPARFAKYDLPVLRDVPSGRDREAGFGQGEGAVRSGQKAQGGAVGPADKATAGAANLPCDELSVGPNVGPSIGPTVEPMVKPSEEGADQGPLAGILAGLDWAADQGADTLVSVAVDTPFLPPDLVPRLLLAADGMRLPMAVASGPLGGEIRMHPACGLWPVTLREDLRAALRQGVRRLGAWADEMGARRAFFADGEAAFFNVNRPEDLAKAEAMLRAN